MPLFIFMGIIQIALVVHIFKTGRSCMWLWLVLLLPGIGSIAYFIVEILPGLLDSREGHQAQEALNNRLQPDKAVKVALQNYTISDTVEHGTALAAAYMDRQMYPEARELLQTCRKGFLEHDPDILLDLVRIEMVLENHAEAQSLFKILREHNPSFTKPDVKLLEARLEELVGDARIAADQYATLIKTYPGPEAKFRYAMLLKSQGDTSTSRELLEGIVQDSKTSGRHYNSLFRAWVKDAKTELATMAG